MMLFFMLLSLYWFWPIFQQPDKLRVKNLCLAGIFWGAAIATKLIALNLLVIFGLFLLCYLLKLRRLDRDTMGKIVLCLLIVPLAIYVGSFLLIPLLKLGDWSEISHHLKIFYGQYTTEEGHNYASAWWGWPLLKRPIWYFYENNSGVVRGILCIGNPAIFWVIPVAFGYIIVEFIRKRTLVLGLILIGFLSQWLPWAFVGRVKFFHYFYTSMPFVCMAIAMLLYRIWQAGKIGRWIVIGYLLVVAGFFIYWYPLLTGLPIPYQYYQHHMWFQSWI